MTTTVSKKTEPYGGWSLIVLHIAKLRKWSQHAGNYLQERATSILDRDQVSQGEKYIDRTSDQCGAD